MNFDMFIKRIWFRFRAFVSRYLHRGSRSLRVASSSFLSIITAEDTGLLSHLYLSIYLAWNTKNATTFIAGSEQ